MPDWLNKVRSARRNSEARCISDPLNMLCPEKEQHSPGLADQEVTEFIAVHVAGGRDSHTHARSLVLVNPVRRAGWQGDLRHAGLAEQGEKREEKQRGSVHIRPPQYAVSRERAALARAR